VNWEEEAKRLMSANEELHLEVQRIACERDRYLARCKLLADAVAALQDGDRVSFSGVLEQGNG